MTLDRWANYFLATAGSAAALTGLIFVAVSLNLQRILSFKHLPDRAMGSLVLLVNILIISSLCLIPAQPVPILGLEILVIGAGVWIVLSKKDMASYKGLDPAYKSKYIKIFVFTQAAIMPYLISGILLLNNREAGLYFLIPGVTFSFFKSLADAWVLLVEINR